MLTAVVTATIWVVIGWLPGYAVLSCLRPGAGALRNAGFAVPVAIGLTMIVAQLCYVVGIRIEPATVLPVTLGIPAVILGVRFLRRRGAESKPQGRRTPGWSVDATLLVTAIGLGLATWAAVVPSILSVLPNDDGAHHALYTYRIEHYGTLDPRVVLSGDVSTGSPHSPYYPLALHTSAALVAAAARVDPGVALTVGMILCAAVVLPLGMYVLARMIFPGARYIPGVAALVIAIYPWFPFLPITWGGVTTVVGMSMIPIGIDALWTPRSDGSRLAVGTALAVAGYGIFQMHSPELVSIALFGLIILVPRLITAPVHTRRHIVGVLGVAAIVFVALVAPQLAQFRAGGTDATTFQGNESGNGVAGGLSPFATLLAIVAPMLLPLAAFGIVVALRRRQGLSLLAGLIVTVLLCVATTLPAARALTVAWYENWGRLSYLVPLFIALFVALAVAQIIHAVATLRARDDNPVTRRLVPVSLAALAIVVVAATGAQSVAFGHLGYQRGSLVSADARDAFSWLSRHVQPGQRVLNQFSDDSSWMQTLDGVSPVFATKPQTMPVDPERKWGDRWYLLTHTGQLAWNQRAQAAARAWNVSFVYVDSKVFADHTVQLSAGELSASPAYREVWHAGDVAIFEVLPERFAQSSS